MPPSTPSAKQLEAQRLLTEAQGKIQFHFLLVNRLTSIGLAMVSWAGWCGLAYFAYKTAQTLAGENTHALFGINLNFLANRYFSELLAWLFGASGIGMGLRYRSLYKRVSTHLKRIETLEKQIDPNRTSSGLEDGWKSNPDDL